MNLSILLLWLGMVSVANAQTENINIPYTTGNAPLIIKAAAMHYGADPEELLSTATCESNLANVEKHWDVNGYAYGVFQFHIKTFYNNATEMGLSNPDITDPVQQAQVAAWMFAKGRQGQWTCWTKQYAQGVNDP